MFQFIFGIIIGIVISTVGTGPLIRWADNTVQSIKQSTHQAVVDYAKEQVNKELVKQ